MSITIPEWHVQQYRDNVIMLSQQRGSRLRRAVREDGNVVGKRVAFDRLGAVAAQQVTTRHADTPLMNSPHSRRWAVMRDFDWADLVDWMDQIKVINDPTNPYAQNAAWSMGRAMDDEVIRALNGVAVTGESGDGTQALPSGQKIVHGSAKLTLAKLLEAKELLDAADVDPDIPRFIAPSASQMTSLLDTTEIKSADFNTVKALAAGQLNSFLGFEFIRHQRNQVDADSKELVPAWAQSAIGFQIGKDVVTDIGPRRDKRNSVQVYVCMSIGAVRVEDEQVVQIACNA